jgi:hypothetical protein
MAIMDFGHIGFPNRGLFMDFDGAQNAGSPELLNGFRGRLEFSGAALILFLAACALAQCGQSRLSGLIAHPRTLRSPVPWNRSLNPRKMRRRILRASLSSPCRRH